MGKRFLKPSEINEIVGDVLSTHEVQPLSHSRMQEIAAESCRERFGFWPNLPLVLLVVKMTLVGWDSIKRDVKQRLSVDLREGPHEY